MSNSYATAALIKELLGYQSPYSTIGQNILEQTKPYPYRMSLGEALGTGLASGLASGSFAAYGKSQEEERNKTIAEALASADPEAALSANPETRDLAPYFSMQKKEQEQERQAQLQKMQLAQSLKGPNYQTFREGGESVTYEITPPQIGPDGTLIPSQRNPIARGPAFRPNSGGLGASLDRPLTDAQRQYFEGQGVEIFPGMSQRDLGLAADLKNRDRLGSQFEEGIDLKKGQLEIPGYAPAEGSTLRPTSTEAKEIRKELGENAKLRATLEGLAQSVDENGFLNVFGNDSAQQGALYSLVFRGQRAIAGTGANLTGNEKSLVQMITPAVSAGDYVGAIKNALTGRDPATLARQLSSINKKLEIDEMRSRLNYAPITPSPLPGESPQDYLKRTGG